MKLAFSRLLAALVFTNSLCAADIDKQTWSQVAYPDYSGGQGSLESSFGPSFYHIDAVPYSTETLVDTSIGAFTLGLSQLVGYSHWFYIQLKESFSYGYTFYGTLNGQSNHPRRFERALFFDGDAKLFFPFRLVRSHRLSLQPFVGFAMHQASLKGKPRAASGTVSRILLKQRYLSPLFGLAVGFNPSPKFALRSSLSVHIPNGKRALPDRSAPEARNYHRLRVQRHGIGADLLALLKLTSNLTLTGNLDYLVYSSYPGRMTPTDEGGFYHPHAFSCLSVKCGLSLQF